MEELSKGSMVQQLFFRNVKCKVAFIQVVLAYLTPGPFLPLFFSQNTAFSSKTGKQALPEYSGPLRCLAAGKRASVHARDLTSKHLSAYWFFSLNQSQTTIPKKPCHSSPDFSFRGQTEKLEEQKWFSHSA